MKYLAGEVDSSLPPQAHRYLKFIYSNIAQSRIQIYRSRISHRCAHHLFFLSLVTQVFTIPSLSLFIILTTHFVLDNCSVSWEIGNEIFVSDSLRNLNCNLCSGMGCYYCYCYAGTQVSLSFILCNWLRSLAERGFVAMADSSSKSALTYMVHVCLYVCMHCAYMCAHSYMCVLPLLEVCYISMETMSLLRAIDRFARSIDCAAPSIDPLIAHLSVDRASIDRSRNHRLIAQPSIDRALLRLRDRWMEYVHVLWYFSC